MSDMGFKFEIGAVVKHAVSANQSFAPVMWNMRKGAHRDIRMLIIERLLQECPGGVQRTYVVRIVDSEGALAASLDKFNEIELVASEPFEDNNKGDDNG